MRLGHFALLCAAALPFTLAQSSTSASSNSSATAAPTNSTASNGTFSTITTTITSLVPGPSGSESRTSLMTLTLTLNTTSPASSNSSVAGNGTAVDNSTMANATEPWREGDDWIPFNIRLDPAYGVLGALLILSGIPVAVLGGKNRWSSLAIVSGYALMLFTLVMILRFGVQDSLQPPSPNPPSQTLRGLYLLACIVATFIGAGIGVFLFNIAKYSVSAAGGFTFGWFLLEVQAGGLITSVLGRWGLLGGLTVASTLASIVPKMAEPMILISTAWIGATAFILGVDCFTRAGLKEFYIYNLGFHQLFPKLEGAKYPLTQTMIIELGILAACVLIGGAIQAKVLSKIQRRLRTAKEEEEMRIEADEVSKAAERFKNIGSELAEWEEKHGNGKSVVGDLGGGSASPTLHRRSTSQLLPILGRDQAPADVQGRASPSLPPLRRDDSGLYEELPLTSPAGRDMGTPTSATGFHGVEQLKDDSSATPRTLAPVSPALADSELEEKLRLLEEVKKARESIRGSIDELRRQTPTPSLARLNSASDSPVTPALSHGPYDPRRTSQGSRILDEESGRSRPISRASSYMLDSAPMSTREARYSTASSRLLDITQDTPGGYRPGSAAERSLSSGSRLLDPSHGRHVSDSSSLQTSPTEWDKYLADRQIMPPPPVPVNPRSNSQHLQAGSARADRHEKTTSMYDLSTPALTRGPSPLDQDRRTRTNSMQDPARAGSYHSYSLDPSRPRDGRRDSRLGDFGAGPGVITGSASSRHAGDAPRNAAPNPRDSMHSRSMTYDELSERHRKRISALQEPVSSKMREEEDTRIAREKWERQKKAERAEMERRQKELLEREAGREEREKGKVGERLEVLEKTDEWRRSVHGGLDGFGRPVDGQGRTSGSGSGHEGRHGSRGTSAGATGRGRERRMSGMIN